MQNDRRTASAVEGAPREGWEPSAWCAEAQHGESAGNRVLECVCSSERMAVVMLARANAVHPVPCI